MSDFCPLRSAFCLLQCRLWPLAFSGHHGRGFDLDPRLVLEEAGNHVNALRVRSFPFSTAVEDFIHEHDKVFIVEQNRDAQLRTMLISDFTLDGRKLVPVLHYDGTPITARFIAGEIAKIVSTLNVRPIKQQDKAA